MKHRHLNSEDWTLPAIDDAMVNGRLADWLELRDAMAQNTVIAERVATICATDHGDEGQDRYAFWRHHVKAKRVARMG